MNPLRIALLAVLLLFSQTYLAREWLAVLLLAAALTALALLLAGGWRLLALAWVLHETRRARRHPSQSNREYPL